jgi:hypothetical protein
MASINLLIQSFRNYCNLILNFISNTRVIQMQVFFQGGKVQSLKLSLQKRSQVQRRMHIRKYSQNTQNITTQDE